jgi:hypothetical protein
MGSNGDSGLARTFRDFESPGSNDVLVMGMSLLFKVRECKQTEAARENRKTETCWRNTVLSWNPAKPVGKPVFHGCPDGNFSSSYQTVVLYFY